MAWRMKLSLPKFKVTQIGDTKIYRNLPRGRKTAASVSCDFPRDSVSTEEEHDDTDVELPPPDVNDDAGPSLHAIKQKASAAAWNKVRATLQKAAIESSALPGSQSCILCGAPATHRCTSCGAWAYYCIDCFCQAHSLTNFFHVGEVWEVSLCSERCWVSYTGYWWRVLGFLHASENEMPTNFQLLLKTQGI